MLTGNVVTVKGPKGTLAQTLHPGDDHASRRATSFMSSAPPTTRRTAALHGLTRTLLHNMVVGVSEGFKKELEINGVGYRAARRRARSWS